MTHQNTDKTKLLLCGQGGLDTANNKHSAGKGRHGDRVSSRRNRLVLQKPPFPPHPSSPPPRPLPLPRQTDTIKTGQEELQADSVDLQNGRSFTRDGGPTDDVGSQGDVIIAGTVRGGGGGARGGALLSSPQGRMSLLSSSPALLSVQGLYPWSPGHDKTRDRQMSTSGHGSELLHRVPLSLSLSL